tara:strand:+ start:371 stop:601 length:231 start_codon:yes stop_codon:yes gene_type:complete
MTKWTINEIAYSKGTSEPVRGALLAMQEKLTALEAERKWVGLTDEEIQDCDPHDSCWGLFKIARAVEDKLKEKNHD